MKVERRRVTSLLPGRMDSCPEPTKEPLVEAEASSKRVPVMTVVEKMKLPGGVGRINAGRLVNALQDVEYLLRAHPSPTPWPSPSPMGGVHGVHSFPRLPHSPPPPTLTRGAGVPFPTWPLLLRHRLPR